MDKMLKKYTEILNLSNWEIQLIEEKALEVPAHTKIVYNDYLAVIKVKDEMTSSEKELSLIHELLHIVFRDDENMVDEIIPEHYQRTYRMFHERAIEQTARSLYKAANRLHGESLPAKLTPSQEAKLLALTETRREHDEKLLKFTEEGKKL